MLQIEKVRGTYGSMTEIAFKGHDIYFFQTNGSVTYSPHLMLTQNSATMAGWSLNGWDLVSPGQFDLDWNVPLCVGRSRDALGQITLDRGTFVPLLMKKKWYRSSVLYSTRVNKFNRSALLGLMEYITEKHFFTRYDAETYFRVASFIQAYWYWDSVLSYINE